MRVRSSAVCLSAALLLAAHGAAAQQSPIVPRYGFDLITTGTDPIAADSAGVGSRAWGVQLTGGVVAYRVLSLNVDGGILLMSDEAPFTQETTQGEKTSGVGAGIGSVSAGLRTPPLRLGGANPRFLSAGVNAGRSWVNVTRTITHCVDCHGEDVSVRAGTFWEPVVEVGNGRGAVTARYRVYGGDSDIQNALMIGFTVSPQRTPKSVDAAADPQ
ncbi:MAG TPA: hypothetical protein VLK84_28825 [Longimicrobium sp.]|nr:hypothetical protein [Longimicrobium sp.]